MIHSKDAKNLRKSQQLQSSYPPPIQLLWAHVDAGADCSLIQTLCLLAAFNTTRKVKKDSKYNFCINCINYSIIN